MGFGLLKGLRSKDVAGKEPTPPQGPRIVGVDPPHFDDATQHQQLTQLHPFYRLNKLLPEPLREKVFEPAIKLVNAVAEKVD
jgi:hypothetical protein